MSKIQINEEYAEIIIESPKYGVFRFKIDLDDVKKAEKYNWCVLKRENLFYAYTSNNSTLLHRLIMNVTDRKIHIDHIDMNTLNNQKYNLRECNQSQNQMNIHGKGKNRGNASGVMWNTHIPTPKWVAYITINRKRKHLGYFDDYEEALKVRIKAEQEIFGEFAPNH